MSTEKKRGVHQVLDPSEYKVHRKSLSKMDIVGSVHRHKSYKIYTLHRLPFDTELETSGRDSQSSIFFKSPILKQHKNPTSLQLRQYKEQNQESTSNYIITVEKGIHLTGRSDWRDSIKFGIPHSVQ